MNNNMIKFFGSTNRRRNLYFCSYHPSLEPAIQNFLPAKTVRVFKGKCYVNYVSFGYFTEILSRHKVPFSIITSLTLNTSKR